MTQKIERSIIYFVKIDKKKSVRHKTYEFDEDDEEQWKKQVEKEIGWKNIIIAFAGSLGRRVY